MKIHLRLNGKVIPATLADNKTAEEFVAMLPLTITLHDLFGREKFGPLPRPISGTGTRTQAYEVGDMICWAPGPDVAILYRQDGQAISGGFHVLGKLDFGAEEFCADGPLEVTIEVPDSEAGLQRASAAFRRRPRPTPMHDTSAQAPLHGGPYGCLRTGRKPVRCQ